MLSEAKKRFDAYIKAEGLKETSQRTLILDAFLNTQRHVSVDDMYALLQKNDRRVGYATVSRTMKLIADSGLAREVMFNDGIARFEPTVNREHHHHLVCNSCGKVIEFNSEKMDKGEIEILKEFGFTAEYHRYEIFGICRECQKKGAVSSNETSR